MSGLLTYPASNRVVSEMVGYALRQAGAAGYLTNSNVTGAATGQDLIDIVNAAVVAPGAESPAQRLNIARAIQEGVNLGDLSPTRVAAATSLADLVDQTWCTADDPLTAHLGPSFFG